MNDERGQAGPAPTAGADRREPGGRGTDAGDDDAHKGPGLTLPQGAVQKNQE